jgi:hypothetical protein
MAHPRATSGAAFICCLAVGMSNSHIAIHLRRTLFDALLRDRHLHVWPQSLGDVDSIQAAPGLPVSRF